MKTSVPLQDINTNPESVLSWLHENHLDDLIPIFQREQLTDWSYVKRLNLPLLQSIHVPLGLAFEFQDAIQQKFGPEVCANPEFESTAIALYEWIVKYTTTQHQKQKEQERSDRKDAAKRPPWCGVMEKHKSHTLLPRKAPLDTGLKK
jgi:hypothetical protein